MALQLILSCDADKTDNGPTLIHSTGVENYKIPPDVIRILQGALSNDLLSDHVDGVLCQGNPQRILDILRQNGFTLENENTDDQKASWTVVQGGHGDGGEQPVHPPAPHPTHDNEADGGDEEERAGGDAEEEEEKKDEEEEEEEEEDKDAEK